MSLFCLLSSDVFEWGNTDYLFSLTESLEPYLIPTSFPRRSTASKTLRWILQASALCGAKMGCSFKLWQPRSVNMITSPKPKRTPEPFANESVELCLKLSKLIESKESQTKQRESKGSYIFQPNVKAATLHKSINGGMQNTRKECIANNVLFKWKRLRINRLTRKLRPCKA